MKANVLLISVIAATGGLLFGFDTGVISGALGCAFVTSVTSTFPKPKASHWKKLKNTGGRAEARERCNPFI